MNVRRMLVLDASVGVKWFRSESGSDRALAIAEEGVAGRACLVAPDHFAAEVLSVVCRLVGPGEVTSAWRDIERTGLALRPLDEALVAEAARQCAKLGCAFYDALAPALAVLMDADLVSADCRVHRDFPGVVLLGEENADPTSTA